MPTVASTYETISTTTLGSDQATVDFTSIPSTYTDLVLVTTIKWTGSGATSWGLSFNADYSTNYSITRFYAYSGGIYASGESGNVTTQTGQMNSGNWSDNIIQINGYTNTNFWKYAVARANIETGTENGLFLGRWNNTSAINAIRCWNFDTANTKFASGSIFTLYGIKVA